VAEISAALEISADRVKSLKRSPLFQEMVSMIEEQVTKSGIADVLKDLVDDAPENLKFVIAVRDGDFDHVDAPILGQRMRAAQWLGDKQLPTQKENLDRAVTVVIGGKLLNQISRAMKNDGVQDAEFEVVEQYQPMSVEDMRAREEAAPEDDDD